jgi:hypothetical protein
LALRPRAADPPGSQQIPPVPDADQSLVGRTVVATTAGQARDYAERALATAG